MKQLLVAFAAIGAMFAFLTGAKAAENEKPPTTSQSGPQTSGGGGGGSGGGGKQPPWNPPAPGKSLQQSEVTPEMAAWAQSLIASSYPMHTVIPKDFGGKVVLGRIEWHTIQARTGNHGLFRAAALYWPS
jgi:hypothetical protein